MFRFLFHFAGVIICITAALGLVARFVPPDVLWPPAIVALVLPILLCGVAIYLAILLWRKDWKKAALPSLLLLLSLPILRQLWTLNLGGSDASTAAITVMTANVHNYKDKNFWAIDAESATDFIAPHRPTVLLMQESHPPRFPKDVVAATKERSGLSMRHQPNKVSVATYGDNIQFIGENFSFGNSANGFLVTDVTTSLGKIRIINAHLQSNMISDIAGKIGEAGNLSAEVGRAESMFRNYGSAAAKRAEQAEAIRKIVRESPHPVILAGDFNDVPSSYTYRRTLMPRLQDAWVVAGFGLGTTFTGPLPGLRIDYIMADTAFTVQSVERVKTGFSDHLALKAVLTRATPGRR